jgi:hypothetical protein
MLLPTLSLLGCALGVASGAAQTPPFAHAPGADVSLPFFAQSPGKGAADGAGQEKDDGNGKKTGDDKKDD